MSSQSSLTMSSFNKSIEFSTVVQNENVCRLLTKKNEMHSVSMSRPWMTFYLWIRRLQRSCLEAPPLSLGDRAGTKLSISVRLQVRVRDLSLEKNDRNLIVTTLEEHVSLKGDHLQREIGFEWRVEVSLKKKNEFRFLKHYFDTVFGIKVFL